MTAYWNSARCQKTHGLQHRLATFYFDHLRSGCHDFCSIAKGVLRTDLESTKRHIAYNECTPRTTRHTLCVINHIAQGDR
jgi:hypothetical protein